MSLVSLQGLTKSYGLGQQTVEVLHGVDLEVAQGEFVALMGPSGSGKSTLLNIIAGLDKPTSGEVVVANERLTAMGPAQLAHWRARNVGFVFQLYNLLPALTAADSGGQEIFDVLGRQVSRQHHRRAKVQPSDSHLAHERITMAPRSSARPHTASAGSADRRRKSCQPRTFGPRSTPGAFRPITRWMKLLSRIRATAAAAALLALAGLTGCATAPTRSAGPADVTERQDQVGFASYYAHAHHGRRTAYGERYDMHALTAAHRSLPFGTELRVTNLANGRNVVVRVNDRGPFRKGRVVDVSLAAARKLSLGRANRSSRVARGGQKSVKP